MLFAIKASDDNMRFSLLPQSHSRVDPWYHKSPTFDAYLPSVFFGQTNFAGHGDFSSKTCVALRERRIMVNCCLCKVEEGSNALLRRGSGVIIHVESSSLI
jgi:hypothetical protein